MLDLAALKGHDWNLREAAPALLEKLVERQTFLAALEWASHTRNGNACPSCYANQRSGPDYDGGKHKDGCKLMALLSSVEGWRDE